MRRPATYFISAILAAGISWSAHAQGTGTRATFAVSELPLQASLDSLMKWYPVSIVYLDRDVEGRFASAACRECSFEDALGRMLAGTPLTWMRIGNQVILKSKKVEEPRPVAAIYGTVTDSLTGEYIAGASVEVLDSAGTHARRCPTNAYGFFSLRTLSPGSCLVRVRTVGYHPINIPMTIDTGANVRRDIALQQEEITLREVTIEGHRAPLTLAQGYVHGVYIPSVPSDQNQYFLDGARIYNPSHFGGVITAFNGDVLNEVEVATGGMPPNFGGRIGGILDLSMRDGSHEHMGGSAGTGSLGSSLSLEGPLSNSTTFLLSGRRSYPEALVPILGQDGTPSRLGSSEIIAKLSHRLSGSSRMFLSGYAGGDSYTNRVEKAGMHLSNNFAWGNDALNLRWIGIASPSLFLHASAVYTRYHMDLEHALTEDPPSVAGNSPASTYTIEDFSLCAHAEHYYDEDHTIAGGVEITHHRMAGILSAFSTQIGKLSLQGQSSWEMSVYIQDQWRILPRVSAILGGRATSFSAGDAAFSGVDPRFSLLAMLNDRTRLSASVTSVNQFIHPFRNSGVFLFYPTVFWYPSTDQAKPTTAMQISAGLDEDFHNGLYTLSVETFYRTMHNLHEFTFNRLTPDADLADALILGTGKTYGLQLTLRRRSGDVSGSVAYTLAWSSNRFSEINGGQPFAPNFDRRHEVRIDALYSPPGGWSFGINCVLASERAQLLAASDLAGTADAGKRGATQGPIDTGPVGVTMMPAMAGGFDNGVFMNGDRFPGFQRLEFRIMRTLSFWGVPGNLSLSFMNEYGLLDPFIWNLTPDPDDRLKWGARLQELRLFPLYPVLEIAVRF